MVTWWVLRERGQLRATAAALLPGAGGVAVALALIPIAHSEASEHHTLAKDAQTIVDLRCSLATPDGLALWSIAADMIKDHPWLGVGLDQMGDVFPSYRTLEFTAAEGTDGIADRVHGDPLHMAVVAGIPAAVVFYIMVSVVLIGACTVAFRVAAAADTDVGACSLRDCGLLVAKHRLHHCAGGA